MFDLLHTIFNSIFGFLILMGVLVTIHEFGHFYVAKKLGFKVLIFSIGFGKPIWKRKGKDGVEYQLGLIPLGGYVSMLDERIHDVSSEQMSQTFNAKPVWKRACVIAAGPIANILLAIIVLWGLYSYGIPSIKPYIAEPANGTIFEKAGLQKRDLVQAVNNKKMQTLDDLTRALIDRLNGSGKAELSILRGNETLTVAIDLGAPMKMNANSDLFGDLGLSLYRPDVAPYIPAKVMFVATQSLADRYGILQGDVIVAIANKKIKTWFDMEQRLTEVRQMVDISTFNIEIEREGEIRNLTINLQDEIDPKHFILGVGAGSINLSELPAEVQNEFKEIYVTPKYTPITAFSKAISQTTEDSLLIFKFIGRMFKGDVHINSMAGPITIADIAGKTLTAGWIYFFQLLALFSINLGMINLLPIPVLDGGRLVGLGIEKIVGKDRISPKISMMVLQIGAFLLFGFMGLVIMFDIMRVF